MTGSYQVNDALRDHVLRNVTGFESRNQPGDGLKHAAVALAIVANAAGEGSILLTRRAPRLNAHAGQWALPGGRLDKGETPIDAALREMHEEVGLDVPAHHVIGTLDDYPTRSGYLITPVVVWAGLDAKLVPNPAEVASIHHVSFTELNRPDSPVFFTIPESDRPVIRLLVENDFVHAPTAAVMYQFAEVCIHGRHTRVDHLEQPVFAWK